MMCSSLIGQGIRDVLLYLSDGYLFGMVLWLIAGGVVFWTLLRLRGQWRGRPKRLNWVNAGLSAWMVLALLTMIELYFALVYDASDSFNMTNVSKKWFKLHVEPQQHVLKFTEREGVVFRDDREFPTKLGSDQRHLVFLGDSFTFAQGVPDVRNRFSNRVRAALEPTSNGKIVVSNLADAGKDLFWIERLLELLFAHGHRIDTAVYVLCLNDIETFHERHQTYYRDLNQHSPQFFLFRDTYFFNWVYFRVRQATLPDVRGYFSFVQEYYSGEPWQRMSRKLDQVQQLCQSHGTDFRVVVFPFLHNLGPKYPFHKAHQTIVEHCQSRNIPVLDLEPELTPFASQGLTANRFDAHPNELAHRVAAEAMLKNFFRDFVTNGNP